MARESEISEAIYRKHIRLYRFLNDSWIFLQLARPSLKERAEALRNSRSKAKKSYPVPKKGKTVFSKRRDEDIGHIFQAQYDRGVFESNIVNIVSRVEAFIQDCLTIAILEYPEKLSVFGDKAGIPVEMFLAHESRQDLLTRYVASKCEGLMFAKPADYMAMACKILSIELKQETIDKYIEIKASRDIVIHNSGTINKLYLEKAKTYARGEQGDELVVDQRYYKHVLITAKMLSGEIQAAVEKKYG